MVCAVLDTWPGQAGMLVDVVWASPPCQDWSSGERAGAGGERNGWPATLGCVRVLRPRLFVGENVAGMTHRPNRSSLDVVLAELRAVGYDVNARVLVASDFGLTPSTSARLFIVARRDAAVRGRPGRTPPTDRCLLDGRGRRPRSKASPPVGHGTTPRHHNQVRAQIGNAVPPVMAQFLTEANQRQR